MAKKPFPILNGDGKEIVDEEVSLWPFVINCFDGD